MAAAEKPLPLLAHVFRRRLRGSGRDTKLASSHLLQNGPPHDLSSACLASRCHVLFRQCLGHVFDLYHSMLQINALWGYLHFRCGHKQMRRSAATPVDRALRLSPLARGGCIHEPGGYGTAVGRQVGKHTDACPIRSGWAKGALANISRLHGWLETYQPASPPSLP